MNRDSGLLEEVPGTSSLASRLAGYLSFVAAIIAACLVIFTLFMTGYSVFQRYVLGTPLTWTDELSGFLVVAIVMLGMAEALRRGDHISVDLLSTKAKGRNRYILDLWYYLATAFVAGVIMLSAWNSVMFSIDFGVFSDGYLEAPLWIPQSTMVVGSALCLLIASLKFIDVVLNGRRT
ncbi:TRAP transporter small permease [Sneathiella limimaris]|uniref:TRAP transporter small permease n=1 Tax=Sneathiella limimaris TaxID=1964213 RepID=UPI00146C74F9|nr:TRAP transporter small permease [Sneathiella limimaris]